MKKFRIAVLILLVLVNSCSKEDEIYRLSCIKVLVLIASNNCLNNYKDKINRAYSVLAKRLKKDVTTRGRKWPSRFEYDRAPDHRRRGTPCTPHLMEKAAEPAQEVK